MLEKRTNGIIIIANKTTDAAAPLLLPLLPVEAMTIANTIEGASTPDAVAEEMIFLVNVSVSLRVRRALKICVAVLRLDAVPENRINDLRLLKHFARAL